MKKATILLALISAVLGAQAQTVIWDGANYIQSTNSSGQVVLTPVPVPKAVSPIVGQVLPSTTTTTTITAASAPLSMLESYIVDNDTNYQGWNSNSFTLWEAAAFQQVNGVPGASAIGNDLGLEVPIHSFNLHVDSVTEFETLFGDIHFQKIGLAYDYNWGQIQMSAGLDADIQLAGPLTLHMEPYFEFKKAATSTGLAPFIRYGYPIQRHAGAGIVYTGLQIPFPKSWKQ